MPENHPVILLMGPTASGKTDQAVMLAERLPVEIISVDSAMVYRGMDIGTAKPEPEVLERAPHALIDILDPAQSYSAAEFRADALREITRIQAAGRIPLLVGGTMLYFKALEQGLADMPPADPVVRANIEEQARQHGWEALHRRLAEVDPQAARRIHPNDPQRLQRALEVYELTGQPLTALIAEQRTDPLPFRWVKAVIAPADRGLLRERIARRFDVMLEQGFLAEVEGLYQRGDLHPDLPSVRCVGYRQAWGYLAGECGREEMVRSAVTATRQLAKRQLTWLRHQVEAQWFDSAEKNLSQRLLKYLADNSIK